MSSSDASGCPLCRDSGGLLVWSGECCRVVRVEDAAFPGFYRVIWRQHVAEMSELDAASRQQLMDTVVQVEAVLRQELAATKINLASLGNQVPHLHWHVIARFDWDSRFPDPVWAAPRREAPVAALAAVRDRLDAVDAAVIQALA